MKSFRIRPFQIVLLAVCVISRAGADEFRFSALYSDHMVLQRDVPCRIWGYTDPGEKVVVKFGGQSVETSANAEGIWQAVLKPIPISKIGQSLLAMSQSGKTLELNDVVVGDVWICSGQSNMGMPAKSTKEIWARKQAEAEYPNIRLFKCDPLVVRTPTKEVKGGYMEQPNADVTRDRSYTMGWARCTPTLAGNFTGTGYYFAEKVHRETEVPIGLLWASIGSVGAECYISPEAIAASPTGQRCLAAWDAKIASGRRDKDNLLYPSSMYKTMLHACQKFPIKGALWYQGESNSHRGEEYRRTLNLLLQDWRARWGLGDFPFLMVQLPEIDFPRPKAKKSHWPDLRDSQVWSSKNENNVGLAVIIDTKEIDKTGRASLHPYNKYLPGHRLAQYAMGTVYGKNTPFRGPTFRAHRVEGSRIIVEFEPDSLGSGLVAADRIGQGVEINRTGVRIAHVDIAGADQNFVPAEATIEGDTLVVSSVNVASPVAVRYAWANNPAGANLYNQEGIPASPFRTDFWPLATEGSNHY